MNLIAKFVLALNPYIFGIVLITVLMLCIYYYFWYQRPANRVISQLKLINSKLGHPNTGTSNSDILLNLESTFTEKPFNHLWREYSDSLHAVRSTDEADTIIRATVPAEIYFTKDALVDNQINADFFRHLPGIMTGIGIIGTFTGLVWGLTYFDPNDATHTIQPLLREVSSAFVGSGIAIFAAILITFFEKNVLNRSYKLVEELQNKIDGLFATGAGEEYLARLVISSEKNSVHTAALKDALIEDLKKLMHEVADKSIAAQVSQTNAIAGQISEAIKSSLEAPFQELSAVVKTASGHQGEAVSGLMENLLTAFMAKLDETFGQQIAGINLAIQKSSDSMTLVQESMAKLIGDISGAGQAAANEMSSKLEQAMTNAAAAQEKMNEQMREFVKELRELILAQQGETKSAMDEAMQLVLSQLKDAIASISTERQEQIVQDRERIGNLTEEAKSIYGGLADSVTRLIDDIKVVTSKTEENINQIQKATLSAITGMGEGAALMNDAAKKFTEAGLSVTGVFDRNSVLSEQLNQVSTTLQHTSSTVRLAFEQYDNARKTTQDYVITLQEVVENAKKEAGMSAKFITDLERILNSLEQAEKKSEDYLNGINEVLKESFETFGSQMAGQVRNISAENDKHITNSLNALQTAVSQMFESVAMMRKDD